MRTKSGMSRGDFDFALTSALDGLIVSDTGAGEALQAVLDDIALAGDKVSDEQVERARTLFAEQQAADKA